MAKIGTVRPPRAWSQRPLPRPWTPEEDKVICDIAMCGVASWAWGEPLPGRLDSEILERRLELREAGLAREARLI